VEAQEPKEIRPPLRSPPTLKKSTCPKNKTKKPKPAQGVAPPKTN